MCFKSHIWKKNKTKPGLVRVRPGPGSTHRVARFWPGCCHSRSFVKPGSTGSRVDPPGRAGFNNSALDQQRGVHVAFINDSTLFGFYFLFVFKKTLRKSRFRLWLLFPFKERRLHKSSYILIHTCVFSYLKL
jgi:hypothetical protein